jgi:hypothetical protein
MKTLFSKTDGNSKTLRNVGLGIALVLAVGMSAAYSHRGSSPRATAAGGKDVAAQPASLDKSHAKAALMSLPLAFEANKGQLDPRVKYLAHAQGYTAYFAGNEVALSIKGKDKRAAVLGMTLQNAQTASSVVASDEQIGKTNYLLGNDRSKWITNVANYGKVAYNGVYPGVDVIYYGNQQNLEYDFVVKPGSSPAQIRIAYSGASRFDLNKGGDLEIETAAGTTVAHKPVVFQTIGGQRKAVDSSYVITARNEVGFKLGAYDASQPLTIDPTMTVIAFFGAGTATVADSAAAIAANSSGVYFTGTSANAATGIPLTPATCNPTGTAMAPCVGSIASPATIYQSTQGGAGDAYVVKLSADGTTLIYSTYLGGAGADAGLAITVDSTGSAYVTGSTSSANFPTTNGSFLSAGPDVFVTKMAANGQTLAYSTLFGGAGADQGNAIAVDAAGNAYVGGQTASAGLVMVNPLNIPATACATGNVSNCSSAFTGNVLGGATDGFLIQYNPTGVIQFATYLGSTGNDFIDAVAVDSTGVYVAGTTASLTGTINAATRFPTTTSGSAGTGTANNTMAVPATVVAGTVGFVTKISLAGTSPVVTWSDTFGIGGENVSGIAVDSTQRAYIAGSNTGVAAGPFALSNAQLGQVAGAGVIPGTANGTGAATGNTNGFVLSLATNGRTASYISFVQAATAAWATNFNSIALDSSNNAYVGGFQNDGANNQTYLARFNPPNTTLLTPTAGSLNWSGIPSAAGASASSVNGIALSATGQIRSLMYAGTTAIAAGGSFAAPTGFSTITPQSFLSLGANTTTASRIGAVTPGGGDAFVGVVTFKDLLASTTNVTFSTGGAQTQTVTVTAADGTAPPCALGVGTITNGAPGVFSSAGSSVVLAPGSTSSFLVTNSTVIPALGTPQISTFQIIGAGGCPVLEPVVVAVTNGTTSTYTAGSPTLVAGGANTTLSMTVPVGTSVISPYNNAALAPIGINLPISASTAVATTVTSVAPSNWAASGASGTCPNPVTVAGSPFGAATTFTPVLTVLSACIGNANVTGTYSGSISVTSTTAGQAPTLTIPYTINITSNITVTSPAGAAALILPPFTAGATGAQQGTVTVQANGGAASYTTAVTNGTFPAGALSVVGGATGSLTTGSTAAIVVQVNPAGLASGTYNGTLVISSGGLTNTVAVTANVGAGLVPTFTPPGGTSAAVTSAGITITLPTGLTATASGVLNVNGVGASNTNITTATNPITYTVGTGWLADALSGTCNGNVTNLTTCINTLSITTSGLAAGTYSGAIAFTSTTTGVAALSVPVTLNVTALPTFLTKNSTGGAFTPPVVLSAVSGQALVCTTALTSPYVSISGGTATGTSFATSVPSGVNFLTVASSIGGTQAATVTGQSITTVGSVIQVCANPQLLGSKSGTIIGTVTVSSSNVTPALTIPVTLLLSGTTVDFSALGVFRPSLTGFILNVEENYYTNAAPFTSGVDKSKLFGLSTDVPVAGDWDGTGVIRFGVFRNGLWYVDLNNNGVWDGVAGSGCTLTVCDAVYSFGQAGDIPVVGDWTGNGVSKLGVFRNGFWFLDTTSNHVYNPNTTLGSGTPGNPAIQFGAPGDLPVVNNWNGTSRIDQIGVFRCNPATPTVSCFWVVDNVGDGIYRPFVSTSNPGDPIYTYGQPGDVPVVGDWNDGGQRKRIGVFRQGTWILDTLGLAASATNATVFNAADQVISYGQAGDIPIVGKWTTP